MVFKSVCRPRMDLFGTGSGRMCVSGGSFPSSRSSGGVLSLNIMFTVRDVGKQENRR